jgi:K+ transporter
VLLALDLGLFAASATKFLDGGWLPVTIAAILALELRLLKKSMIADGDAEE